MNITKQIKLWYYIHNYMRIFIGRKENYEKVITSLKSKLNDDTIENIQKRVDYYCKIQTPMEVRGSYQLKDLKSIKSPKAYYFDTYEYARFFPENYPIDFVFGDVIDVPITPSIVKSRPIVLGNENSILLKLDKARHFIRINKDKPYKKKIY